MSWCSEKVGLAVQKIELNSPDVLTARIKAACRKNGFALQDPGRNRPFRPDRGSYPAPVRAPGGCAGTSPRQDLLVHLFVPHPVRVPVDGLNPNCRTSADRMCLLKIKWPGRRLMQLEQLKKLSLYRGGSGILHSGWLEHSPGRKHKTRSNFPDGHD